MKTKVALGLSLGCLLFCLGGLIMNHTGEAQITPISPWDPIFFGEDPLRQHALNIRSFDVYVPATTLDAFEVPPGKIFILTDARTTTPDSSAHLFHQTLYESGSFRFSYNKPGHLVSGAVFKEGMIKAQSIQYTQVCISGYFVDL